jgi:hypothetical protein
VPVVDKDDLDSTNTCEKQLSQFLKSYFISQIREKKGKKWASLLILICICVVHILLSLTEQSFNA